MTEPARVARHVRVRGRVQGVGFRYHTRAKAEELGLAGWVRNLPDGSVEARLEGEAASVERMLAWLGDGPEWARVEGVESASVGVEGAQGFRIVR